jgi:hypothetical protein
MAIIAGHNLPVVLLLHSLSNFPLQTVITFLITLTGLFSEVRQVRFMQGTTQILRPITQLYR